MPERIYQRKVYKDGKKKKKIKLGFKVIAFLFFAGLLCSFIVFVYYAKDLPRPERFTEKYPIQSTKIYDRSGEIVLYEIYGEEKRTIVLLGSMPEHLRQAVLAMEDSNFYEHFGIDFTGITRSVLLNLRIGKPTYGGSTIHQQLIRSTFLSLEKTVERKIREIILSLELDRRYSKDQILEWYLNQIPLGSNSYGVEAASQTYFKKSVSEISVAEAAILVAVIQAPSYYSPYGPNLDGLLARKDLVLNRMFEEGYLTKEEFENVKQEEIEFIGRPIEIKAPYFTLWIKQQLEEKYGEDYLRVKGLKVYTSLDWELQEIAERVTRERIEINKSYNAHNAGLVAINPNNGEVLAMTVGTGDYYEDPYPKDCVSGVDCLFDPKFNVVLGTKKSSGRQPGSSFKPFVYVTAFENGFNDETTVMDKETSFGIWGGSEYIPQNYDNKFRGEMTIRDALAQSINVPAVSVLMEMAGLEDSIKTALSLGISTLEPPYGPSIVLGGLEVKLIEMVSAYSVFATEGLRVSPVSILKIEDYQGNILEENKKTPMRVLEVEPIRIINDILSDNKARTPVFGSRSALYIDGYQVAAKTGTTDSYRDAWTIGYTPSITVGVWVGNNNNTEMKKAPGVVVAAPIWKAFLIEALPKFPKEEFIEPIKLEEPIN